MPSAGSLSFCHPLTFNCFETLMNGRGKQDIYNYMQTAGHIQYEIQLLKFHYSKSFSIASVVNQAYFKSNTS